MTSRQIIYSLLMWAMLLYAMRRGGRTECLAAWIIVVASVLTGTVTANFRHVQTSLLGLDITVFLAFFAIGLFSRHYWPMWIAAMAGLTVLGHLVPLMPTSSPWVYRQAVALWSWPTIFVVIWMVHRHSRKMRVKASSPG